MEAHRCWAGSKKGAIDGVTGVLAGMESSDDVIRAVLSRGGMAVGGRRGRGRGVEMRRFEDEATPPRSPTV